jgi:hypothetical protein
VCFGAPTASTCGSREAVSFAAIAATCFGQASIATLTTNNKNVAYANDVASDNGRFRCLATITRPCFGISPIFSRVA